MGSYFGADSSTKYALVFEHAELEMIFADADDSWIELEHSEMIPRTIQTLFDTLTKFFVRIFKADCRVMKVKFHVLGFLNQDQETDEEGESLYFDFRPHLFDHRGGICSRLVSPWGFLMFGVGNLFFVKFH